VTAAYDRELALAMEVAREAGGLLKADFGKVHDVDYKGRINLVTEMDRRSEELIVARLKAAFPGDDIVAEEGGGVASGATRRWIVDPLDGTTNYAHEYPVWSVSIALEAERRLAVGVVYNPLLDDMYAGRRGGGVTLNGHPRTVSTVDSLDRAMIATGFSYDLSGDSERNNLGPFARFLLSSQAVRRAGSAALAIAKVAVGRTDGFWERDLSPWDMAAAMLLVEEAGGTISDYQGGSARLEGGRLVASNGRIHSAMLEVLERGPMRAVPSAAGDPPPRDAMMTYFMAFLYRGPIRIEDERESDALQRAHLANIHRLREEGKIILSGPFRDQADMRGLFLFKVETLEEAQALCASDPAIAAGALRAEVRPWYSAKGIGIVSP
jgi:myo-inositol-1(or 4)-monophosphatase